MKPWKQPNATLCMMNDICLTLSGVNKYHLILAGSACLAALAALSNDFCAVRRVFTTYPSIGGEGGGELSYFKLNFNLHGMYSAPKIKHMQCDNASAKE